MAKEEAGPLNGTVWPILISVSVTPGPYFFSAAPALPVTASRPTSKGTIGPKRIRIRQRLTRRAGVGPIVALSPQSHNRLRSGAIDCSHGLVVASYGDVESAVDAEMLARGVGRGV